MKWCCAIFEGFMSSQGERGLSVIVANIGVDRFMLQGRAVDAGVQPGNAGVMMTIEEQQVIFHCPGCGVNLLKYYAKDIEALRRDDLALR